MELYDTDQDGELNQSEMESVPALLNALAEIDTDSSGTISEAEIRSRVEYFVQTRTGRISIACRVVHGGRPIPNAIVTFEPEPFIADMIEPATGSTMRDGMAMMHVEDNQGGVQPGFYKVRITRLSASGRETLPAKYNNETTLGQEITTGSLALSEGLVFEL